MRFLFALVVALAVQACPNPRPPDPPPGTPLWDLQVVVRSLDAVNKPLAGVAIDITDGPNASRDGITNRDGVYFAQQLQQAGQTICANRDGYFGRCVGVTLISSMSVDIDLEPVPPPKPPVGVLAGRIRAEGGYLVNDAGPWVWRGRSDFDLLRLALDGNWAAVDARLDDAVLAKLTNLRVFAMAANLFRLTPDDPGYMVALAQLQRHMGDRGLYMNLCVFPDAQILYPNASDRLRVLQALLANFGTNVGIIWELANEPWQNGWSGATDPALLDLAHHAKAALGHSDFIIGDPRDGDDPDASAETVAESRALARIVNLLALHSSRKGGANTDGDRMRRWVDHLEGAYDIVQEAKKVNGRAYLIQIEPMGHASQQWVPIPGRNPYEREFDGEVALSGASTALFANLGYTYHRIAAQDPGVPGQDLIARFLADVPTGNGWVYRNDSWDGSATRGFSCKGKVRSWVNGTSGFVIAYGNGSHCTITWANGYTPVATRFRSDDNESGRLQESKVALYEVRRQ